MIKRPQFRIILFITADLISIQGFREKQWDMLSPISTPASQKVSCVWTAARTLNNINKRNTYPQLCQTEEKKQEALQLSLSWIPMAGHFLQSSSQLTNILSVLLTMCSNQWQPVWLLHWLGCLGMGQPAVVPKHPLKQEHKGWAGCPSASQPQPFEGAQGLQLEGNWWSSGWLITKILEDWCWGQPHLIFVLMTLGEKKKKYKSKQISPSLNDWRLYQYQEDWSLTQKEMND